MSTNTNTTNIPDQRFAEAIQVSFRGRPHEITVQAHMRFLAALINIAYKSRGGPVVLRVHNWEHLNDTARLMVELFTELPKHVFRRILAKYDSDYQSLAIEAMDAIVYENVAVRIADGDNPRWIVLASLAG